MKRYKVEFEFRNGRGEWVKDYLNNNGEGFTHEDAVYIAKDFQERGHINVQVKENIAKYKVVMESSGGVRYDLVNDMTLEEATEFCVQHDWIWIDYNEFEWGLDVTEDHGEV